MGLFWKKKPQFTDEERRIMDELAKAGLKPAKSLTEPTEQEKRLAEHPADRHMDGGLANPDRVDHRPVVDRMKAETEERNWRYNRAKELHDQGMSSEAAKAQAWREDRDRQHAGSKTWQKLRHPEKKE